MKKIPERFRYFLTLKISVEIPNFMIFLEHCHLYVKNIKNILLVKMKLVSNVEHINVLISSNLVIIRYFVQELFISLVYIFLR